MKSENIFSSTKQEVSGCCGWKPLAELHYEGSIPSAPDNHGEGKNLVKYLMILTRSCTAQVYPGMSISAPRILSSCSRLSLPERKAS